MRAVGPSFLLLQMLPQDSIRQNQSALAKAQVELSTQRHSDVLQKLGGQTGRNIRWHAELTSVESAIQANSLHDTRANVTQTSLQVVTTLAADFLNNLISSRGAEGGQGIIQGQAKNTLAMLRDALNVDIDGFFLFGGRNQTSPPMLEFTGSAGEAQFDSLFQTEFGVAQTDPAVLNISPTQLQTFLDGNLASMFLSPSWETYVSTATSQNITAYVGNGEKLDILSNANEEPIRQLYAALTAITEISSGELNDATFKSLVDAAASKVSSAVQGLADIQSRVGLNQKSLEEANNQLKTRKSWLNEAILKTESVDTYEVATRINGLMTQLEASYSVTSRLSRISLLNYL
jgi:flagellar hook-associated protein 3 FlgL